MSKKKVFISYSRRDREFVEGLIRDMRKQGVDVWFDKHLKSGADWDDALEEQIRSNDHMVIVLSETSAASDNVKNEMRFALDHGKRIHPILYKPCSVPLSMRRMHYVDFTSIEYEDAVRMLVSDINGEPMKEGGTLKTFKKKSPWKPIVFGILGALAIGIGVWQLWPSVDNELETTDPIIKTETQEPIANIDDSGWRKIMNSTDPYDYSNYVKAYGDDERHMNDAINKLQDLFKDEGSIILRREDISTQFTKLIFKDNSGNYFYNKNLDDANNDWPVRGDMLVAQKQMSVLDPKTSDVYGRVMLMPGDFVQYVEVMVENSSDVMIRFYFNKEVIPLDPNWDTRVYKSKYNRSKIPQDMKENDVWNMVSKDKENLFEGLLYYFERYGNDSQYRDIAWNLIIKQFDKEGYAMYEEPSTGEGPFFKPYMFLDHDGDNYLIVTKLTDRQPKFGDFVIGTRNRATLIYDGIFGVHETSEMIGSLAKDQMAMIIVEDLSQNEIIKGRGNNLYFKIKYRDYD